PSLSQIKEAHDAVSRPRARGPAVLPARGGARDRNLCSLSRRNLRHLRRVRGHAGALPTLRAKGPPPPGGAAHAGGCARAVRGAGRAGGHGLDGGARLHPPGLRSNAEVAATTTHERAPPAEGSPCESTSPSCSCCPRASRPRPAATPPTAPAVARTTPASPTSPTRSAAAPARCA